MKSIISTIATVALVAPVVPSFGSMGTVLAAAFPAALVTLSGAPAEARGGGGRGGGGRGHGGGQHSGGQRHSGHQSVNKHVDRNKHKDVNRDIDIDKDVDIDVDVDDHHKNNNDLARAVAAGLVVGAVVNSIDNEAECVTEPRGDVSYLYCDGVWYEPQYSGSNVTYIVVNEP